MKNIFFSYCWGDNKKYQIVSFIDKLITKLEYKNENFYLDIEKNNLGDQYWKNIKNAIETSQIFIFFNSPNYCNSSACCKEYVWALKKSQKYNFKIIEIKLENSNLYRPYRDEIYVKYDDINILEKFYNAIYKNDFSGFEIPLIFHDLITIPNNDGTTTIKFKLSRDVLKPEILIFVNKNDEQKIDDIVRLLWSGIFESTNDTPIENDVFEWNCKEKEIKKFNFFKNVLNKSPMYENDEITILYKNKYNPILIFIHNFINNNYEYVIGFF